MMNFETAMPINDCAQPRETLQYVLTNSGGVLDECIGRGLEIVNFLTATDKTTPALSVEVRDMLSCAKSIEEKSNMLSSVMMRIADILGC